MANERDIRTTIEANTDEIAGFGNLSAALTKSTGGRPGTAYHLNKSRPC